MKLVVIAGPYRAKTEWALVENIRRAEVAALEVWKLGAAVICPHKNTAHFGGAAPDRVWLEGAKEMLRRADAVVTVEGWEASEGAQDEVRLAQTLGIPVFHDPREAAAWLRSQA